MKLGVLASCLDGCTHVCVCVCVLAMREREFTYMITDLPKLLPMYFSQNLEADSSTHFFQSRFFHPQGQTVLQTSKLSSGQIIAIPAKQGLNVQNIREYSSYLIAVVTVVVMMMIKIIRKIVIIVNDDDSREKARITCLARFIFDSAYGIVYRKGMVFYLSDCQNTYFVNVLVVFCITFHIFEALRSRYLFI